MARARRVIAAYTQASAAGKGAVRIEGRLVEAEDFDEFQDDDELQKEVLLLLAGDRGERAPRFQRGAHTLAIGRVRLVSEITHEAADVDQRGVARNAVDARGRSADLIESIARGSIERLR